MENVSSFTISGTKNILFRKEYDGYVFFEPHSLEFYTVNQSGAEILYLISKGYDYIKIKDHFTEIYDINEGDLKSMLEEFLVTSPILSQIYPDLIAQNISIGIDAV